MHVCMCRHSSMRCLLLFCVYRWDTKRAKAAGLSLLPIIGWMRIYQVKNWLLGDILSGVSTGLVAVMQGEARKLPLFFAQELAHVILFILKVEVLFLDSILVGSLWFLVKYNPSKYYLQCISKILWDSIFFISPILDGNPKWSKFENNPIKSCH